MQKRAADARRSQPMRTVTQPGCAAANTGSSLTSSPAKNAAGTPARTSRRCTATALSGASAATAL